MQKKCAGQTGCYLSKCIGSIRKPSPPAAAYTSPLNKMLHALTGSQKPSTPSPVTRGADYVTPYKKKLGYDDEKY